MTGSPPPVDVDYKMRLITDHNGERWLACRSSDRAMYVKVSAIDAVYDAFPAKEGDPPYSFVTVDGREHTMPGTARQIIVVAWA